MTAAIATLLFGFVIGYLGQQSRLCLVSGYRDLVLTGDPRGLAGVGGIFLGAMIGYAIFSLLGGMLPDFPLWTVGQLRFLLVPLLSAFGFGVVAMLAEGCPFRMHVLAGQGNLSSWAYLLGFYVGLVCFNVWTEPVLVRFAE
jgi:uncharacterized protein